MTLTLHKDAYSSGGNDLYKVTSKVDGKNTFFDIQCLQTKTDPDIETLAVNQLEGRGYASGVLTPIEWE